MIGSSLWGRGGVASVQRAIIQNPPDRVRFSHLTTVGTLSPPFEVFRGILSIFRLMIRIIVDPPHIVHLHVADGWSTWRKVVILLTLRISDASVILHMHAGGISRSFDGMGSIRRQIIRRASERAIAVIVPTNGWAAIHSDLLNIPTERMVVIPNPCTTSINGGAAESFTNQDNELVRAVFAGRLNHRKGIQDLIKAVSMLREDRRESFRLTIAGAGDNSSLLRMVEEYGLENCVTFSGWLESRELMMLLERSDLLVHPSHEDCMPMSILEAMGLGLAILSTEVGGIPEMLNHGECGVLCPARRPEALRKELMRFIEDRRFLAKMRRAALRGTERFAPRVVSDALRLVYESARPQHPSQLG